MEMLDIISVGVDIIAVGVAGWSCLIAKKANKKSEEAIKISQSVRNNVSQIGENNLSNSGQLYGNMIGEQHVNK